MNGLKLLICLPLLITLILGGVYFYNESNKQDSLFQIIEKNDSYLKERVIFDSSGKNIYGLLIIPASKSKVPAVIVLPAAGGKKESRAWYADMFLKMGYAALILDQRGIGETDGKIPSILEDAETFKNGEKSVQELFVEDVINAFDVLSKMKEIDSKKIAVLGESMGGGYSIIAAGKDKRIKAVFVISSSGYKGNYGNEEFNKFIAAINPNEYISKISPRKVVMFHSDNDSVILLEDAQYTYSLANNPKEFVLVKGCEHGYCDAMYERLKGNLQSVFSS